MGSTAGLGYKLGSAALIFAMSFFFAYLPFMIKSFKTNKTLISLANCFAGGIFLSAALIHIIPEAFDQWGSQEHSDEKQLTNSIAFLESVNLRHEGQSGNLGNDSEDGEPFPWVTFSILASFSVILLIDRVLLPGHHDHGHEDHDESASNKLSNKLSTKLNEDEVDAPHEHDHSNAIGPYMLIVAMGVHAIFEGLALGLLTDFAGFLGFMMAIVFHKWAECMAVGISFLKNNVPKLNSIIALAIFAFLTPSGILAGIIFSDTKPKIKAILMGISAGTFLYIAIAEVLAEEFNSKKNALSKYMAYLAGASVMIIVWGIEQLGSMGK